MKDFVVLHEIESNVNIFLENLDLLKHIAEEGPDDDLQTDIVKDIFCHCVNQLVIEHEKRNSFIESMNNTWKLDWKEKKIKKTRKKKNPINKNAGL